MEADVIYQLVLQYGLAGVVIYIFYSLVRNELRELKYSVDRLTKAIERLIVKLEK